MHLNYEAGKWTTVFWLVYMLFMFGISIAAYVLKAAGMHCIAKRRGIKKPWLAWIPVAQMWTLGCISDQYQYVVKGKVKNKRKSLLVLNILMWAACIALHVAYAFFAAFIFMAVFGAMQGMAIDSLNPAMAESLIWMLVVALLAVGFTVAVMVIQYMALYDLYRSCDPNNGGLYLVLSIFFSIALPVFVFVCREKDLGMPPRRVDTPPQTQ